MKMPKGRRESAGPSHGHSNANDGLDTDDEQPEEDEIPQQQQDPKERREIRHKYRTLLEETQKNKHDLINPESDELRTTLLSANELFRTVQQTREAALDSQLVAVVSSLARQKAQALNTDIIKFQPVEFTEKLISFMSGNQLQEEDRPRARISREGWEKLGEAVQPFFKRSPPFRFMYGSFEQGPVIREQRAPKVREKDAVADKDPATQLRAVTEVEKHEATSAEVERILNLLQHYYENGDRQPVCYFEFVINPRSFGQTIENVFYTSFLVKDGHARIFLDSDKLPVIEPVENEEGAASASEQAQKRHQVVLSITQQDWRDIIKTFNIQDDPLIPSRDTHSARGAKGPSSSKRKKEK